MIVEMKIDEESHEIIVKVQGKISVGHYITSSAWISIAKIMVFRQGSRQVWIYTRNEVLNMENEDPNCIEIDESIEDRVYFSPCKQII